MILAYGMGGRCILRKSEWGCPESRQAHSSSSDDRQATAPKTLAMVKMTCRLSDAQQMIASYTSRFLCAMPEHTVFYHIEPLIDTVEDCKRIVQLADNKQERGLLASPIYS